MGSFFSGARFTTSHPGKDREQLRRWLKDGSIRIGPAKDGSIVAEGELLPLVVTRRCAGGRVVRRAPRPSVRRQPARRYPVRVTRFIAATFGRSTLF
jgi:hypothetical protein